MDAKVHKKNQAYLCLFFITIISIEVRECNEGDIVEIDTFRELKVVDKTYDV